MLCDPAFRGVVDAFRDGVGAGGAALCVRVDGRVVVDVWHGTRDADQVEPWLPDTAVNVFSVTKGVLATVAHRLVATGALDLDAPVARYWPEFRAEVTVAQLLDHQAGLPAVRAPLPVGSHYDWDAMTTALAAEEPWWEPGTRHGYHALTFGWLVGEVLRRVTGSRVRDLVAPLGVTIGWPGPGDPADVLAPEPVASALPPSEIVLKAFANPLDLGAPDVNGARWRQAEIPAANGHATARALAALYGRIGELLPADVLDRAAAPHSDGVDEVLGGRTRFGLGYMLPNELRPYSPNPRAFGHTGAGGALAFADPDRGIAFGYTPNRLVVTPAGADPRWLSVVGAVYSA
ncbi:serine hydrolase domain-containing protein [Actinosynnema sp. NPDC020468]|uniref:serine hydrolase domain-containing protein n=1 Tax=Actinosynnema sp. NPDC020468 TaxID=3154488 RepID=UPI003409E989